MLTYLERQNIDEKQRRIEARVQFIMAEALQQADLYEERRRGNSKDQSEKDKDDVAAFNDEERALSNNPDATSTMNGRIIRRHGSKRPQSYKITQEQKEIARALSLGIITIGQISAFVQAVSPLSGSFQENVSNRGKNSTQLIKCEDDRYVYDTTRVDNETKAILDRESAVIEAKIAEMQAVEDPDQREKMALAIIEMAEDFEMRPHPVTQRYVHNIDRVDHELKSRRVSAVECHGKVCVFRVKMEVGDVRGVKRVIGDQFNQDPQEMIASGDHLKVQPAAVPVPPPRFNHS